MQNDRLITITTGKSRMSKTWTPTQTLWSELVARLSAVQRSTETYADYMRMSKSQRDELKDVGGYVGGTLAGSQRNACSVTGRDVITLDLDNIEPGKTSDVLRIIDNLQCGYCVYSTRKHSETGPRLRVLLPLIRTCTADEYEPAARKLAECIGIHMCDPTTYEPSRLMYWPSCSSDSQYIYQYADRPFIDVDGLLAMYSDWHNVSEWPGLTTPKLPRGQRQADPTDKQGIVGAFCRRYDIHKAIAELIPDAYTQVDETRYTYAGGSTVGGAVVYDDGKFLFSHHATDPAGGRLCNAFDLVRWHLFADRDDEAKADTPANRLPSYTAMCEYAAAIPEVTTALNAERYAASVRAFGGSAPVSDTEDNADWISMLEVSERTGIALKTIDNVCIILEHDPMLKGRFVFDEFSNRIIITGPLPWSADTTRRYWEDNDDAGLRHYIEKAHHIKGEKDILDAFSLVIHRHKINEVKEYLLSLPAWDGIKRLDTLFIDYLGVADNEYTRAATRKSFAAAVARIMVPGTKYDTMPILAGAQGIGKSTMLRILGGRWFSDSLCTFTGKEACELIQGVWINEIGELNAMTLTAGNQVKQFLSKTDDIFRAPYGRRTEVHPRRCVFFGTTNEYEYLKDKTGNRRFWPLDCGIIQPAKSVFNDLPREAAQVWAEAVAAWRLGESLFLTPELEDIAKQIQQDHTERATYEGIVLDFLDREVPEDWQSRDLMSRRMYWSGDFGRSAVPTVKRDKICALEVWCEALDGEPRTFRNNDAKEINAIIDSSKDWERPKSNLYFGKSYGKQRGFYRRRDLQH